MIGIYRIRNIINNKSYIGKSEISIERRLYQHRIGNDSNTHLQNAIKKYGIDNFEFSIVEECSTELCNERERYWISYYDSYNNGYNRTTGGEGGPDIKLSDESRKKMSLAKKGKIKVNDGKKDKFIDPSELEYYISLGYNKGSCRNISGKNNPMYGIRLTGERHWNYGKRGSECPNYGKKYTKHTTSPSSLKGRIYITNGVNNKMIFKEELDKYIANGWRRGHTCKHK